MGEAWPPLWFCSFAITFILLILSKDLDEEDLTDTPQSSSDDDGSEEDGSDDSGEDSEDEKTVKKDRKKGIPVALQKSNLPRFARAKRRQRKGKE